MSEIKDGGSAFPRPELHDEYPRPGSTECRHLHAETGMSLRDYLAAKAMQGDLASWPGTTEAADYADQIAERAYLIADAMLKARGKSREQDRLGHPRISLRNVCELGCGWNRGGSDRPIH